MHEDSYSELYNTVRSFDAHALRNYRSINGFSYMLCWGTVATRRIGNVLVAWQQVKRESKHVFKASNGLDRLKTLPVDLWSDSGKVTGQVGAKGRDHTRVRVQ